ncbi:MAG: sigma 54-interacting transcriptional regulator [Myxococcota bacterium]
MLETATKLAGRYAHRRELGRGASGRVLLAEDLAGDLVALKVVPPASAAALRWELEVLQQIAHPQLASVRELLVADVAVGAPFHLSPGSAVLVEEYVPGARASQVLDATEAGQRPSNALRVIDDVLSALVAIHDAGILHGDIKPSNILVKEDGRAVLVDLGLAGPPSAADGLVRGTVAYLAPEAWIGERSIATDLFAVGATLLRLLGADLDDGHSSGGARGAPPSVGLLPGSVSPALRTYLGALLAPDPADRPLDARDALAQLRRLRQTFGEAVEASALPDPSPAAFALRAERAPWVGDESLLRSLTDRLQAGGVVRVSGPKGAGRSRLVAEAVARLQRSRAASMQPVPTYLRRSTLGAMLPNAACVLHLTEPLDAESGLREARAASVSGRFFCLVMEVEEDGDVHLGPLGDAPLKTLMAHLRPGDSDGWLQQAKDVSGGLAGRLCRAVVAALRAGGDPRHPVLEDPGFVGELSEELGALVDRLAVAGGSLSKEELSASPDQVARLIAVGAARREGSRLVLRRSLVTERLGRVPFQAIETKDSDVHAYLAGARGEDATEAFATAIDRQRDRGDVRRALRLAEDAARFDDAVAIALRHADALRADGRYREAIAVLEGRTAIDAQTLRAEILRQAGRSKEAESVLGDLRGPEADRTRGWLSIRDPDGPAPSPEIAAWRALVAGDVEAAEAVARRALKTRSDARGARQDRARLHATLGSVLHAKGDAPGAAREYALAGALAEALGERHLAATSRANGGAVQLDAGVLGEGREALIEGARALLRLGRDRDAARALINLASVSLWVGDDGMLERSLDEAIEAASRAGDEDALATGWLLRLELLLRRGDLAKSRAHLSAAPPGAGTMALARTRAAGLIAAQNTERARELIDPNAGAFEVALAKARIALATGDAVAVPEEAASSWEQRLAFALLCFDVAEAAADGAVAESAGAEARAVLDEGAASLSPELRRRMRRVPAYQRVLGSRPAAVVTSRADRWRQLTARAKRLTAERRIGRLREEVVDAAVDLVDAERGFWVERQDDGDLRIRSARGHRPGEGSISRSVVARAWGGRRPVRAMDALEDEVLARSGSVHAIALRSVLCVPLALQGRDGALYVDDRVRPAAFDEEDAALLADLGELAVIAVEGAERLRTERRTSVRLERLRKRLAHKVASQQQELQRLARKATGVVATSEPMRRCMDLAARVAPSDLAVLVVGESGSGKERVARAVHTMSARAAHAFVAESCGAIGDSLLESTLFGHEKGAFTGAAARRQGLFELADRGTLFLDEIGEMSSSMQAKLLRVLQEGEFRRVGSERVLQVDVRVIAATHRDLRAMVDAGTFREDLYYRLAVVTLDVPPLRERPADLPILVQQILSELAEGPVAVTPAALRLLAKQPWPGNVRELANTLQRALVMTSGTIDEEHLSVAPARVDDLDLQGRLAELERELIQEAMRQVGNNKTKAAALLGISRYGLQKKLARLKIAR